MQPLSDNYTTGNEILDAQLQKLQDLDLTGRIEKINQYNDAIGGFSDVRRGILRKRDGSYVVIAVKRVPTDLRRNVTYGKARLVAVWMIKLVLKRLSVPCQGALSRSNRQSRERH